MEIAEIQKVIRATKQNPRLSEDEIIEKLLGIDEPFVRPSADKVLLRTCTLHGKTMDDIRKVDTSNDASRVRQQFCLLAWLFDYTEPVTGRTINRNHSSAHIAKKKALSFYILESDYREEVDMLIKKFPKHAKRLHQRLGELIDEMKK